VWKEKSPEALEAPPQRTPSRRHPALNRLGLPPGRRQAPPSPFCQRLVELYGLLAVLFGGAGMDGSGALESCAANEAGREPARAANAWRVSPSLRLAGEPAYCAAGNRAYGSGAIRPGAEAAHTRTCSSESVALEKWLPRIV